MVYVDQWFPNERTGLDVSLYEVSWWTIYFMEPELSEITDISVQWFSHTHTHTHTHTYTQSTPPPHTRILDDNKESNQNRLVRASLVIQVCPSSQYTRAHLY